METEKEVKEFSLCATFLQPAKDLPVDAFRQISKAKNWKEFRAACDAIDVLSLNITYADTQGNIGYCMTGDVPLRHEKAIKQINLPLEGASGELDWQGYIPKPERPHCLNPAQEFIISCNHRVVSSKYKYFIGNSFKHGRRAVRVEQCLKELIAKKGKMDMEDMKRIQLDNVDPRPESVTQFLKHLDGVNVSELLAKVENPAGVSAEFVEEVIALIKAWDGHCSVDSVGATFHLLFGSNLLKTALKAVFKSEKILEMAMGCGLSEKLLAVSEYHSRESKILRNIFEKKNGNNIIEKAGGPHVVVLQALVNAIVLARTLAKTKIHTNNKEEARTYRYGLIHTISFNHAAGSTIPDFNRGPYPIGGGANTVNLQAFYPNGKQFEVTIYPSWRMVVDMADVSQAEGIFAPGNSANMYSKHYDDNIQKFIKGEFNPMYWKKADVTKNAEGTLQMTMANK